MRISSRGKKSSFAPAHAAHNFSRSVYPGKQRVLPLRRQARGERAPMGRYIYICTVCIRRDKRFEEGTAQKSIRDSRYPCLSAFYSFFGDTQTRISTNVQTFVSTTRARARSLVVRT